MIRESVRESNSATL